MPLHPRRMNMFYLFADEANKDYHRTTVSIGGGNRITDPPYNPPSEPTTKSTIWEPISPYRPTNPRTKQTIPPSTPRITWPNYNTATTKWQPWTPFPTNDNYLTDDEDDEKFVMPKWPKRRKPKKQTQSTVPTTTTTTTTTLPPREYIRHFSFLFAVNATSTCSSYSKDT